VKENIHKRLVLAALKFNVSFRANHIAGKQNVIADQLSRFQFQKANHELCDSSKIVVDYKPCERKYT
jgi:hypothetical protein